MIKKIKWKNHEVLGNLELDFCNESGKPYNTIVFAGENGSGKTSVLETLFTFLNLGSILPFEYIRYNVDGSDFEVFYTEKTTNSEYGCHERRSCDDGQYKRVDACGSYNSDRIDNDKNDIRHYGVAYSGAKAEFTTAPITSTTTRQLDSNRYNSDDKTQFTEIKQLLVDLNAEDNADWMRLSKERKDISIDEFLQSSRLSRFENAFNSFFNSIEFKGINESSVKEKEIEFKKMNATIGIDAMSTGEKQIVFRGAFLLSNIKSLQGGVVMIDEPELGLHPKWQVKILQYYRSLFCNEEGQFAQMFFATHSGYVIKEALRDKQNVCIIILDNIDGKTVARKINSPSILPTITAAETNYLAFNIYSFEYHSQLYGYLQNLTGTEESVTRCDNEIFNYIMCHKAKWGVALKESGLETWKYKHKTLCTYIRNSISHPDNYESVTEEELRISIKLLIEICRLKKIVHEGEND